MGATEDAASRRSARPSGTRLIVRQALWHASENSAIERFVPHRAATALDDEELVWAIDDAHLPSYWFPRDCPRATFWAGPRTTPEDAKLLHGSPRVHAIEWDWWDRFREARIFLYRLPEERFASFDEEAGYWVAREPVEPLEVVAVPDLLDEHKRAGIELRLTQNLWPLWNAVIESTLEFSGIRLRNAQPPPSCGGR
jgi:hypothetical protein